jgi:HlyD family secretion protein
VKERILSILLIVLLTAVVGWGGWTMWARRSAEPTIVASLGSIQQTVVATGRVAPVTEIVLANKIPGRIKAVLVKEGDTVEVGQPVILFDDREMVAEMRVADSRVGTADADVQRARRTLEATRARWREVKSGARPQEVERARAEAEQARQRYDSTELERSRYQQLVRDGFVARSQYDAAATEAEVARARLRVAEQTLSLIQAGTKKETVQSAWAQVLESESELKRAESYVKQATAERERARAMLRTVTVESTVNGKVTRKMVEPGEAVDIGIPLMVLSDVSRVIVKAEVDETDLGKLRLGQQATVSADAFPGRAFPATIYEIGQSVGKRKVRPDDPTKIGDMKVLEAKLEITKGGEDLRLGMTVDVKVFIAQKEKVVVIPRHLVTVGKKEAVVSVEGPGGVDSRRITLGMWDDTRVEVIGGLSAGDRVLARPPAAP